MGSIKDRNGLDLTEAEDIKKRWQEYTEELYEKDLHSPDNHDECPCQLPSTRNLHYSIQDNSEWLSNATPFNLLQLGYASPGPQNIKGRKAGVLRILVLIA